MTRFGPGPMLYAAAVVGLGLLAAFFLTGRDHEWLLAVGSCAVLCTLPGWNWYRLDGAGIHRRGIANAKFVPWEAVDAVLGRTTVTTRRVDVVLTQFVVDRRNRPLMRLDSWIGGRRHMVRLIRATVHAREREDPPRDA